MQRFAEIYRQAFGDDEDTSEYTNKLHVSPLPSTEVRNAAAAQQLAWKLSHGAKGYKAVIDGGDQDGKTVGCAIWHPPGSRATVLFESTDKADLDEELKEMLEPMNLEEWNKFYGGCQGMIDKHHADQPLWSVYIWVPRLYTGNMGAIRLTTNVAPIPGTLHSWSSTQTIADKEWARLCSRTVSVLFPRV